MARFLGAPGARLVLGAVAVLAAVATSRGAEAPPSHTQVVSARDRTPPPAPRFRIKDLSGRTLDLDQLRQGGPVLLDFWATWCKPCHAAVPTLEAWHKQYGAQGLTVIGISVDGPRNYTKVRPFASRMGITYPVAIDQDGRLQQLYQVIAMPTAILVAPNGTIATVRVGYRPGENAALEEKIRALLAPAMKESRGEPAADSTGSGTEKP